MSWTDIKSIETMKKLRDRFDIKLFVETGTFRGQGSEVYASHFETLLTVEVLPEYYWNSKNRLNRYTNIYQTLMSSPDYLKKVSPLLKHAGMVLFFLDAHFYDKTLAPEDRWVILKELRALEGFGDCVIIIHDFNCNGLGGLVYDEQPLNFEFVQDTISKVNLNFHYYFNTFDGCDILTKEKVIEGKMPPLTLDSEVTETLDFVWSKPETIHRAYRGFLYATPEPIDLTQFELVETH